MKKVQSIMVVLLMVVHVFIPFQTVFAEGSYTITIDDVSMTGSEITDYNYSGSGPAPTSIVIPHELGSVPIKSLGDSSFNMRSLVEIALPNSITSIGDYAFAGNSLSNIIIPSKVTHIGEGAFDNNLFNSMVLPASTKEGFTFLHWVDSRSNTHDAGTVTDLSEEYTAVFATEITAEDVLIVDNEIVSYNYSGSETAPTNIVIPSNLDGTTIKSIGQRAFYDKGLTNVILPDSLIYIAYEAFGNNLMAEITLPTPSKSGYTFEHWVDGYSEPTTFLGGYGTPDLTTDYTAVFTRAYTLTKNDVVMGDNEIISYKYSGTGAPPTNIVIPSNLGGTDIKSIGQKAFYDKGLTNVKLPDSLIYIACEAFESNQMTITLPTPSRSECTFEYWIDGYSEPAHYMGGYGTPDLATDYTAVFSRDPYTLINDDVVMIGNEILSYNFSGQDPQPDEIIIPNEIDGTVVQSIGCCAFRDKGLKSIELPSTIIDIGANAFAGNIFTSITPQTPEPIEGGRLFLYWKDNNSCTYASGIPISDFSIRYCAVFERGPYTLAKDDVVMVDNKISSYNFSGAAPLPKDIIIPSIIDGATVKSIGELAFFDKGLTSVDLPNTITYIGSDAFESNSVTSIMLPLPFQNGYTFECWEDGNNATYLENTNTNDLKSSYTAIFTPVNYTLTKDDVVITGNEITSYNFSHRTPLPKIIVIPEEIDGITIKSIADEVFKAKELTSVSLPDTLTSIGENTFADNSLSSITLPNSLVSIGANAFTNNLLKSFELPNPSKPECDFIDWIDLNSKSRYDDKEVITDLSASFTARFREKHHTLTNGDVVVENNVLKSYHYSGDELLPPRYITIPGELDGQTIKIIGRGAFMGKSLTRVNLPNSLLVIRDEAFHNNRLNRIVIPEGVTSIGEQSFSKNKLESIKLPTTLRKIEKRAFLFNNSSRLTSVTIPNSVTYIGRSAFYCLYLRSFTLKVPVKNGFTFVRWDYNSSNYYRSVESKYINPQTGDITVSGVLRDAVLIAKFEKGPYTLTSNDVVMTGNEISSFNLSGTVEHKDIIIPNKIGNIDVKSIGYKAFKDKGLNSVTLPDTITYIGPQAFAGNSFTSITLPTPVKEGCEFVHWSINNQDTCEGGITVTDLHNRYSARFSRFFEIDDESVQINTENDTVLMTARKDAIDESLTSIINNESGSVENTLKFPVVEKAQNATGIEVSLSTDSMQLAADNNIGIEIAADDVKMKIPSAVLDTSNIEGVDEDGQISIERNDADALSEDVPVFQIQGREGTPLGKAFNFNIDITKTDGSKEKITQFEEPITVTIQLTAKDLEGIEDYNELKMCWYDPDTNETEIMESSFNNKTLELTFSTNHFSIFMLVKVTETEAAVNVNNTTNAIEKEEPETLHKKVESDVVESSSESNSQNQSAKMNSWILWGIIIFAILIIGAGILILRKKLEVNQNKDLN